MCLSKLIEVTDDSYKGLGYYIIYPLTIHYESIMLYNTHPLSHLLLLNPDRHKQAIVGGFGNTM